MTTARWIPRRVAVTGLAGLATLSTLVSAAAAQPNPTDSIAPLDPAIAAARAWSTQHLPEILADYFELLALPNVARDLPAVEANAQAIARRLTARGATLEIWRLPDFPTAPPVVYGRLAAEPSEDHDGDRRTLGLYIHYDGQPVDPAEWRQSPWQPTLYTAALEAGGTPRPLPPPNRTDPGAEPLPEDWPQWRIYGRSASDDKAPFPALFAALDALRAAGIPRTVDLVFLFEGEEEAGSPHLRHYLEAHREELAVDAWLICDGPVHPSRRPQVVFGVRGYTGMDMTVYGAERYLHSGHYGNWAPNPAMILAHLLASMKDAEGQVTIPGFYTDTALPSAAERAAAAAVADHDDALRRELGLAPGATEGNHKVGGTLLAERILLPSLNIRGMDSAAVGAQARNIIPTTATASLDIRLALGDDPVKMLDRVEAHIRAQGFHIVRDTPDHETRMRHRRILRVDRRPGYPAARTPMDSPLARAVTAAVARAAHEGALRGAAVALPTLGGSLPLYLFNEVLQAPVVILPIANHDNNQHAPNENLALANLAYGIDLMAAILTWGSAAE